MHTERVESGRGSQDARVARELRYAKGGVTIQPPGGVDLDVGVTRLRGRLCNLATCSHRGVAHRNTPK